jgi:NADPH:quinone reductase-like Zn-dependent oxidoreductase
MTRMKAITFDRYGSTDLLELRDVTQGAARFDHPWNLWLGPMGFALRMAARSLLASQRMVLLQHTWRGEDLDVLTELIEAGHVTTVVDRTFPLVEAREGMDHLATRRARGKVVITV